MPRARTIIHSLVHHSSMDKIWNGAEPWQRWLAYHENWTKKLENNLKQYFKHCKPYIYQWRPVFTIRNVKIRRWQGINPPMEEFLGWPQSTKTFAISGLFSVVLQDKNGEDFLFLLYFRLIECLKTLHIVNLVGRVMICGCFTTPGPRQLEVSDETMNSTLFQKFLKKNVRTSTLSTARQWFKASLQVHLWMTKKQKTTMSFLNAQLKVWTSLWLIL